MADFEEACREHQQMIHRFLLRLCGNQQLAEEVTQGALLHALRHWDDFRGESSITTWLCTIAKRQLYSTVRRKEALPLEEADGCYAVTLPPHTTLVRDYHDRPVIGMSDDDFANAYWLDGLVYADPHPGNADEAPHQIRYIRVVSGTQERIVYQAGDNLPFCSPEMAESYRIDEEIDRLSHNEQVDQLLDDMIRQRQIVPE